MNKPIPRHKSLQPVSKEHHQGLLLCWKIRQGLKNETAPHIIDQYVKWFFYEYLQSHFEVEEQSIFPILGNENKLVKRALDEHKRIRQLALDENNTATILSELANLIDDHIRFEERVLFNEIQNIASEEQLNNLNLAENETDFCENSDFSFWK